MNGSRWRKAVPNGDGAFEAAVRKLEDEQAIKQHEKIATLADIPKPSARLIPQTEESLRRQEEEAERLQLDGFLVKPVTKSMIVDNDGLFFPRSKKLMYVR